MLQATVSPPTVLLRRADLTTAQGLGAGGQGSFSESWQRCQPIPATGTDDGRVGRALSTKRQGIVSAWNQGIPLKRPLGIFTPRTAALSLLVPKCVRKESC